jgi:hypothetical protein
MAVSIRPLIKVLSKIIELPYNAYLDPKSLGSGTPDSTKVLNGDSEWVLAGTLRGLYVQTSDSTPVTNTTVESSLIATGVGTLSVPANGFKVGDSFHAKLIGNISCNNAATIELRVKSGSVLLADTGVISLSASTNRTWEINVYFTIRALGAAGVAEIASGGIFSYIKNAGSNFEGTNFSIVNNTTLDTTVLNTLDITAQWGAASASNSINSEIFILSKMY